MQSLPDGGKVFTFAAMQTVARGPGCVKKAHIGRPAERRLHLIAERKTFLESIL